MEKAKRLIVVLTLNVIMLAVLGYLIATNNLVGTSNNSPIILMQNVQVSSTELTKAENQKFSNEENKITVTSRSGKHEDMSNLPEINEPEVETPQPEVPQVEEAVIESSEENSVETPIEEPVQEPEEEQKPTFQGVELEYSEKYNVCSSPLSKSKGVTYYEGHKETYYSQKVLPGKGLKLLNNNGRHVADDGTVRDGDGYIAVACNYLSKGSEIMTSLGPGKVYDTGSMQGKWIDIYVNW